MTIRPRLVVFLAGVCLLSLPLTAASRKVSAATARIQISLADILFDNADYRTALHTYIAATDCEDQTVRDRARAGAVRTALRLAEFRVAASHLAALSGSSSADPATLALAGDALWASGRFDEGEKAYRDALALAPDSAMARHGLAKALASTGHYETALDEIHAALREAPRESDLRNTLGSILERMHRYEDAATAFTEYLDTLKGPDRYERSQWARTHIAFLRSFGGVVPFQTTWKGGEKRQVIDFRLVNGKVIVKGKINGRNAIDFALDTGSEHTALSERTARRFQIQTTLETLTAGVGEIGMRGLRIGRLNSLEIGSMTVFNLPCMIKTPVVSGLPTDQMDGFSPLALGLSMTIDYRNRKLYVGEPLPDASPAQELPLRYTRLPTVQGMVNGSPASFIVDTGGEAISISTSTARTLFAPDDGKRIKLRVYGASGLDPEAYLMPGVRLAFGPLDLSSQSVVVLNLRAPSVLLGYEVGGIIGYRLLGKYRVEIDLQGSRLRLRDM